MIKATQYLLFLVAFLACLSVPVEAQTTGTIAGIVTDEKEAVIPNAAVTARNIETNISRKVQTNSDGRYRFENLPVGPYEVTVESSGFAKYVQTGITLLLSQRAVVDVAMKRVGSRK